MLTATKAKVAPGKLLIGGEWIAAERGRTFDTSNPATAEVLTQVADASQADVDRAVTAARNAFDDPGSKWRKMSASERSRVLYRIGEAVEQNIDELAELGTLDNGKPIFEPRFVLPNSRRKPACLQAYST